MAAAPAFAPLDVDAVRSAVAAGRPVRVGILPTGQFPDGAAGRVRAVGAPDADGPEFIRVEVVVGGAKDVVPFAPADLSPLRRGQTVPEPIPPAPRARRASTRTTGSATAARSGPAGNRAATPPARTTAPVAGPDPTETATVAATPERTTVERTTAERTNADRTNPDRTAADRTAATGPTTTRSAAPGGVDAAAPGGARTGRAASRKPTDRARRQPITVTVATTEPDHTAWTVKVTVGSRTVVKPTPVHPAQAWTLVTGLGQPEVEQFVAGALADHRRQAQERADRLAQELAAARADLAAYPDL